MEELPTIEWYQERVNYLMDEMKKANAQLAVATKDTERLEWMFSHGTALWDTSKFSNFREAIDAALDASEGSR